MAKCASGNEPNGVNSEPEVFHTIIKAVRYKAEKWCPPVDGNVWHENSKRHRLTTIDYCDRIAVEESIAEEWIEQPGTLSGKLIRGLF